MAPGPLGFRQKEHLKSPLDFRRAYERKRSASDEWLIVYACENGLPHLRLGLSVSKKIGIAVFRNRLKRLYREAFRLTRSQMPTGLDLVLIPRSATEPTLAALLEGLPRLVNRIAAQMTREAGRP